MATRRRPHDPAKALHAAQARKERDAEAKRLESQGATVKRDKAGNIVSAYRSNVFNLLLTRKTITQGHHDAAQDLCELWAVWKALDGKAEGQGEFVDNGRAEPDKRCLVTDRMVRAGSTVAAVMFDIGEPSAKLLKAFMVATVEEDRAMAWRGIVQRETGETVRDRQTKLVVSALGELQAVFQGTRERAA